MHYRAAYCAILLCCLASLCPHACARSTPLQQDSAAVLPHDQHVGLPDAHMQGAGSYAAPPPTTTHVTISHKPLMLTVDVKGTTASNSRRRLITAANTTNTSNTTSTTNTTASAPASPDPAMVYKGGKVMSDGANVYMIYVGYKPTDATPLWMNYLAANLGSTRWWAVMKRYAVGNSTFSTDLKVGGVAYLPYIHARNVTDLGKVIRGIVQQTIDQRLVAKDVQKGIYVVVYGADKGLPTCEVDACGAHGFDDNGIRHVHIPAGCTGCGLTDITNNGATSPSGDTTIDGACDTLVHELAETVTDPFYDAWGDGTGAENGDKCAFNFGSPGQHTMEGRNVTYNQIVAGYPYLLQQMWDPKPIDNSRQQVGCVDGVWS